MDVNVMVMMSKGTMLPLLLPLLLPRSLLPKMTLLRLPSLPHLELLLPRMMLPHLLPLQPSGCLLLSLLLHSEFVSVLMLISST